MNTQGTDRVAESEVESRGGKYLSFFLDDEEYGIEILRIREIIGLLPVTVVPRTPDFVRGVVNLRGKVIPVVDLRVKFGMDPVPETEETCIIVVQSQENLMGVMVDKVSEVLDINGEEIVDAPSLGHDVNTDYILGIGKSEGGIKLLLDIEKALMTEGDVDLSQLRAAVDSAA
ncbi:MAG: chemotaxis protein CheW [Gemmatimonadota bacterium]